ncbi:MAG TPA: glutaminyl-peptide cyclotransferase [Calditrichia bacterium]|nr:glutaminyl-peptide cyclotransferase [Calditrichia bacterium]
MSRARVNPDNLNPIDPMTMPELLKRLFLPTLLLTLLLVNSCSEDPSGPGGDPPPSDSVTTVIPQIDTVFLHDNTAFTQGLLFQNGRLFESTGLNGASSLREVDPESGAILRRVDLPDLYFGEGLAYHNGRLYQLTWRNGVAFVYDPDNFAVLDTLSYSGEGWGLTSDGVSLIMSNGTADITFRDEAFAAERTIRVRVDGMSVSRLNELEYANGRIYANVWLTDTILEIDPEDGAVQRVIDASSLTAIEAPTASGAVLNGIAFYPERNTFWLTGKLWSRMFEVRLDGG